MSMERRKGRKTFGTTGGLFRKKFEIGVKKKKRKRNNSITLLKRLKGLLWFWGDLLSPNPRKTKTSESAGKRI